MEHFRESGVHGYLEKLASYPTSIDEEALQQQFEDTLTRVVAQQAESRRLDLLEKSRRQRLEGDEKQELLDLLSARKAQFNQ